MRTYRRRLLGLRSRRDDRGVAMLYVISLMLVGAAALTPLSVAVVSETRQSGRFRQSNAALSAAEGQLDGEIARITSVGSSGQLPCTGAPVTQWTGVDSFSVTTTISYKNASGTDLGCPVPVAAQPTTAVVRAVATSPTSTADAVPVRRVMQSTLRLTLSGGPGNPGLLPSAIYGGQNLSTRNGLILTPGGGSLAPPPRIYSTGDFTCTNGMSVTGSILVQGKVTAQNNCIVTGDIHSVGDVTIGNGGSFGGDITASAGSVSLGTGGTIAGSVYASGTVSGCLARCYPFTPPAPPETEPPPAITWDAAKQGLWQNAGWTVVSFDDPSFCNVTGGADAPARWLINNGSTLTSPTLVHTTCKFVASNGVNFTFNQNVAVIADGGADFGNTVSFAPSTAGSSFYLIQPQNAVTQPCPGQGLNFGNSVTISPQLVTLLYTPCDINLLNSETLSGQVYAAGQFIADNGLTMAFAQLPVPGQGTGTGAYSISVTSKYEAD